MDSYLANNFLTQAGQRSLRPSNPLLGQRHLLAGRRGRPGQRDQRAKIAALDGVLKDIADLELLT